MSVTRILRLEGLAVFLGGTAVFVAVGGPWWLYLLLVLAPDLGMAGYLVSPSVGARTYNAVHTYVGPLLLAGVGAFLEVTLAGQVAAVWIAHVGADRAIGYGLKYPSGFSDTHLDEA